MVKIALGILILSLSSIMHAQENKNNNSNNNNTENFFTSPVYNNSDLNISFNFTSLKALPSYASIYTRIEGLSTTFGSSLVSTTGFELTLGKKVYYYFNFGVSYITLGEQRDFHNSIGGHPLAISLIQGPGFVLYDKRNTAFKGWTITMNLALGFRLTPPAGTSPTSTDYKPAKESIGHTIQVSTEINNRFRYHVNQKFGIQLGLNLGIDFALRDDNKHMKLYVPIRYGAGFGFIF